MLDIAAAVRACAIGAVVAITGLTAGCVQTTGGMAVKPPGPEPADVPLLTESALDRLVLSNQDLNNIIGTEMVPFSSSDSLNDNADLVSEPDCLGAVYPAEMQVYDGTGWTAVRDELFLESGSPDDSHFVEQALVLLDTAETATDLFERSRDQWRDCVRTSRVVIVDDSEWKPADVREVSDQLITQDADVYGDDTCQHALGVVSNLIVESLSCDVSANDDAEQIVTHILDAAENE